MKPDKRSNEQWLDVQAFHASDPQRQARIESFLWRNGISPDDTYRIEMDYTPAGRQRVRIYSYKRDKNGKFYMNPKTGEFARTVTTVYNMQHEQI